MHGRRAHDPLLCIIRVMECGWDIETVINLSKLIDYGAVPANPYYLWPWTRVTTGANLSSKCFGHWERTCKIVFFAHNFVRIGSIYVKARSKWASVHSAGTSNTFHQRKCFVFVIFDVTYRLFSLTLQCESKKSPPTVFWNFFPNGWEFLINFYTPIILSFLH